MKRPTEDEIQLEARQWAQEVGDVSKDVAFVSGARWARGMQCYSVPNFAVEFCIIADLAVALGEFEEIAWHGDPRRKASDEMCISARELIKKANEILEQRNETL